VSLRHFLRERADDALAVATGLFFLVAGANVLYAIKTIGGIDLFPEHAGSAFSAGRAACDALGH